MYFQVTIRLTGRLSHAFNHSSKQVQNGRSYLMISGVCEQWIRPGIDVSLSLHTAGGVLHISTKENTVNRREHDLGQMCAEADEQLARKQLSTGRVEEETRRFKTKDLPTPYSPLLPLSSVAGTSASPVPMTYLMLHSEGQQQQLS